MSSNDGPLLSEAAVAKLEATRNINDLRKHARELGFRTQHRNPDGGWRHRSRTDILESCRGVLNGVPDSVGGHRALKRPASSTFAYEIQALESIVNINHFRQRVRALGVATQYRNAAGHWVNHRKADMLEDCRRWLKA